MIASNEINNQNINESIVTTSNDNRLNTNYSNNHHQKGKSNEENFVSYDDTIIPAVLKKLNNEPQKEEDENGDLEKGELEPISPNKLKEYELIVDVIGELELRKLFSKQILWKEEGLKDFLQWN